MTKITQKSYGRKVKEGHGERQGYQQLGACCNYENKIARQREWGQTGKDEEANVQV